MCNDKKGWSSGWREHKIRCSSAKFVSVFEEARTFNSTKGRVTIQMETWVNKAKVYESKGTPNYIVTLYMTSSRYNNTAVSTVLYR